jgi:uncharacterized YceG family protein
MPDRTPEEREAARIERERRRAAREGRPLSDPPAPPEEAQSAPPTGGQIASPPAVPVYEPQPTQQFDVTADWTDEHAVAPVATAEPEEVPLGTRRVTASQHPRWTERHRPHRRPRVEGASPPGGRRLAGRVVAVVAIVLVAVAAWFVVSLFQPFAGGGNGRVVVRIPRGATASQVGDLLAGDGVVSSSFFFNLRATLDGKRGDIKSGTFTLRHDMSYGAALGAITKNPPLPPVVRVTVPEGQSRREAAPLVKQDGIAGDYLAASRAAKGFDPHRYGGPKGATLEGFLFPATYELKAGATAGQLVAEQLAAFRQRLAGIDLRYARSKHLTVFDVVTIASMVEREVAVPRERPLVAAVIYNRLHDGMPLGIDATLRFALHDWTHPLTLSELANQTPYNTRVHQGLPPGPIGSPGLASLQAAARPAKVPYLFYVVKPGTCGQHAFSSTDAQFQRDVARYNAARAAAGGKSPEKC